MSARAPFLDRELATDDDTRTEREAESAAWQKAGFTDGNSLRLAHAAGWAAALAWIEAHPGEPK